ncbi:MAG: hypothetical protein ACRECH_17390 [Nitrososphaerales archaeon]
MKIFRIRIEQLTDESVHAILYRAGPLYSKKLGTFSGTLDDVLEKAGNSIRPQLEKNEIVGE